MDVVLTSEDILKRRAGVCRDFVKLFTEMCEMEGIRVKRLHGFARGYDFRAGYKFQPGKDSCHAWNAVFLHGAWRFVDCTWGTGKYFYLLPLITYSRFYPFKNIKKTFVL